ncbi:hypothetical protein PISMIDRAFT_651290 [Pisolithus microcarpus 441]|uniref:Uncharacterized protein n=1 Tax=Pisolithus microcarpus 441 TaxID=765257 RepID=A0A0C9ZSR2_9AGAM|nr:hypothetical protein PISMIDRAFT_651290 [Pisolithus microcarpus 441]
MGTSTPLCFPLGSSPTYSLAPNYLPHPRDQWKFFQKFIAYPPPPHETPPFGHIHCTRLAAKTKGSISHCSWLIWPPPLHLCVHACQQGHL